MLYVKPDSMKKTLKGIIILGLVILTESEFKCQNFLSKSIMNRQGDNILKLKIITRIIILHLNCDLG